MTLSCALQRLLLPSTYQHALWLAQWVYHLQEGQHSCKPSLPQWMPSKDPLYLKCQTLLHWPPLVANHALAMQLRNHLVLLLSSRGTSKSVEAFPYLSVLSTLNSRMLRKSQLESPTKLVFTKPRIKQVAQGLLLMELALTSVHLLPLALLLQHPHQVPPHLLRQQPLPLLLHLLGWVDGEKEIQVGH